MRPNIKKQTAAGALGGQTMVSLTKPVGEHGPGHQHVNGTRGRKRRRSASRVRDATRRSLSMADPTERRLSLAFKLCTRNLGASSFFATVYRQVVLARPLPRFVYETAARDYVRHAHHRRMKITTNNKPQRKRHAYYVLAPPALIVVLCHLRRLTMQPNGSLHAICIRRVFTLSVPALKYRQQR